MRFRQLFDIFIVLSLFFLSSCQGRRENNAQKTITVSINPLKFFASKIAGKHYAINVLLPPGANHESWEPTPNTMTTLSKSSMLVIIGLLDFEMNLVPKLKNLNPGIKVVNTSQYIPLISSAEESSGHKNHGIHHDPHTWLSPESAKSISKSIYEGLLQSDPEHAHDFEINYKMLLNSIDSVDKATRQILSTADSRSFLIYHPALAYFSKDYSLQQVSIENEGKEPTPNELGQLVNKAKEQNIRIIFVSKEFDTRIAEIIAQETKVKLATFEPMSEDWPHEIISIAKTLAGVTH